MAAESFDVGINLIWDAINSDKPTRSCNIVREAISEMDKDTRKSFDNVINKMIQTGDVAQNFGTRIKNYFGDWERSMPKKEATAAIHGARSTFSEQLDKKTISEIVDKAKELREYMKMSADTGGDRIFPKSIIDRLMQSQTLYRNQLVMATQILNATKDYAQVLYKNVKTDQERLKIVDRIRQVQKDINNYITISGIQQDQGNMKLRSTAAGEGIYKEWDIAFNSVNNYRDSIIDTTKREKEARVEKEKLAKEQEQINDRIGIAISKLIRYRVAFYAMRGAIEALRDSMKVFTDMELVMARLNKVLPETVDANKELKDSAYELGYQYSVSALEVGRSMQVWAQMGLNVSQTLETTKATLLGVNAIEMDAKEVTEALTSAIFTYGVAIEESTQVIAKWMAVQAAFPVEAKDLANAMKIVGAAARVVGVDIDDLTGYVSAINAVTRKSGTAIGQSLKTMFARLPRKEVIDVFEGINIAVLQNAYTFRDLDDILDDLSVKWGTLDDVTKANIAVTLGGIRRYSDFVALMDNYAVKQKSVITAQKASTEALRANQLEVETIAKSWESFKVVISEFGERIGSTLLVPITNMVSIFNKFLNFLKPLKTIFGGIVGAFATFLGVFLVVKGVFISLEFLLKIIGKALTNMTFSSLGAAASQKSLASSVAITNSFLSKQGATLTGLSASMATYAGILSGVALAVGVLVGLWALFGKKSRRQITDYNEIGESAKERLLTTEREVKSLESQNDIYDKNLSIVKDYIKQLNDLGIGTKDYNDTLKKVNTVLDVYTGQSIELNEAVSETRKAIINQANAYDILDTAVRKTIESNKEELKVLKEATEERKKAYEMVLKSRIADLETEKGVVANIKNILEANESYKAFNKTMEKFSEDALSSSKNWRDLAKATFGGLNTSKIGEYTYSLKKSKRSFTDLFGEDSMDILTKFQLNLSSIKMKSNLVIEEIEKMFDKMEDEKQITKEQKEEFLGFIDSEKITGKLNAVINTYIDLLMVLEKEPDKSKIPSMFVEFTTKMVNEAALNVRNSIAGIFGKITLKDTEIRSDITKLQDEIVSLFEIEPLGDKEWKIGQAPSKEIIAIQDKIKGLKESAKDLYNQFIKLQKTSPFGTGVADQLEFFGKESIDQLKTALEIQIEIGNTIDDLTKKQSLYNETITKLKDDTSDEEMKKFLLDYPELYEKIATDRENSIDSLDRELIIIQSSLQALSSERKIIKELANLTYNLTQEEKKRNNLLKERFLETQNISGLEYIVLRGLEFTSNIYEKLSRKASVREKLEKELINTQYDMETSLANQMDATEKFQAVLKANESKFKSMVKLLEKMSNIRLSKIFDSMNYGIDTFRKSVKDVISSIPENIETGSEKRYELNRDLADAEKELQEARRDGDRNAIQDAEYRLKVVRNELNYYKAGIYEIKQIFNKLFDSVGKAYWDKLASRFAESLSNISIGTSTLGQEFAQIFEKSTGGFIGDYTEALKAEHVRFLTEYWRMLNDFLTTQREIMMARKQEDASGLGYKYIGKEITSEFDDIIKEASKTYDVPEAIIKGIIKRESNFDPRAGSSVGARGLMQLMPKTAVDLGVDNRLDPYQNIMGGTKYFKEQYDKYKNLELALAAYNAGPGRVDEYGGIPPFKETQEYVKAIMESLEKQMSDVPSRQMSSYAMSLMDTFSDLDSVVGSSAEKVEEGFEKVKTELSEGAKALRSGLAIAAASLGQAITAGLFEGNTSALKGASFGGMFGPAGLEATLGKSLFESLGIFGGPLGILGGSLIGGLFGSLFGKGKEPEKPSSISLDENTRAIERNTLALEQLDQAIFNAPTRYNIPAFSGQFGTGNQVNITINGNNSNPDEIATAVIKTIENNINFGLAVGRTRGYNVI